MRIPPSPAKSLRSHRLSSWPSSALLAVVLLVSGLCITPASQAQETDIVIQDMQTELRDGVWHLSARVDYQLNRQMLDALQNGIRLTFSLQVEIDKVRNWLPDSEVASLQRDYELSWQPLSRGYVVRDTSSDEQTTHTTLFAALHTLGSISGLPLIEASRLDPAARHEIRLRALLNQQQLPGPLRILAFWNDDFSLESDWHQWPLEE